VEIENANKNATLLMMLRVTQTLKNVTYKDRIMKPTKYCLKNKGRGREKMEV
jgi:hypothetical protein